MANYVLAAVYFTVSGTTVTIQKQQNVASVVRNATGQFTINFTSTLSTGNYGVLCDAAVASGYVSCSPARNTSTHNAYSTSALDILVQVGTNADPVNCSVIVFDPSVSNTDILAAGYCTVSGTTATLVSSTGISSVTRVGTGLFEWDWSPTLANANYSAFGSSRFGDAASDAVSIVGGNRNSPNNLHTTTKFSQLAGLLNPTGNIFDVAKGNVLVRDSSATATGILASVRFTIAASACTIVVSNNVSSVTYNSGGNYTVNFTSALADANYGTICSAKFADFASDFTPQACPCSATYSTAAVNVLSAVDTVGLIDAATFDVMVFDPSLIGTSASTSILLGQAWM